MVRRQTIYTRLEKLVKLGYLIKNSCKGYCNTYELTKKAEKVIERETKKET